ncbi:MAG TPA: crosslink repair DNA glycosylase YcaQ family protein [Candidatus Limnocylindrales bacterium]|nr:crosslink repair DNA glycosylase YcaQ family protein [Candidatus Limnocylindrales bacterium]
MATVGAPLVLSRDQILARRRAVSSLDERLPAGAASLRVAAWAGLSDSMPRAAILSIHARVEGTGPGILDDPSLVQVWGPRFSAYVVAAVDRAPFTLGRLPVDDAKRRFAIDTADQLEAFLAGRAMPYGEAGRGLGRNPNSLRYGTTTGRILIRWEGARQPTIWTVPAPDMDPHEARLELARRYLRVFGPGTRQGFGDWAGVRPATINAAFDGLAGALTGVRTPIGDAWILAEDETGFRAAAADPAPARLLPSGDTFYLLQDPDRALLVPDAKQRSRLWTSRVWPGAVLIDGEVAGTWRRGGADVAIEPWRPLSPDRRAAVEAEAASLPLPGLDGPIRVRWEP